MAKVSIIVPIYNVEPFLCKCVDSILAQTFRDFELILVDDGSPDNCGIICDEYAHKNAQIKVIHKNNGGLASARNAGLDIASGDFILFCDSDDYVLPYWCEHLISQVRNKSDNYIFGGMNIIKLTEGQELIIPQIPYKEVIDFDISDFLSLQTKGMIGFSCNVLYYTDVLRKYNIRFSTDVIVEDLPFNLEYLQHMSRLTYSGFADYCYIQDERETLSRKYYKDGFKRWQEKYRATQKFIRQKVPQPNTDEVIKAVSTSYLYPFLHSLDNTFDKRNDWSQRKKLAYNYRVVKSEEFQHCLTHADTSGENHLYIYLLRHTNYYCAYLLQKIAQLKNKYKNKKSPENKR